ncbi:MAG TPA: ABC transporter ATP-binding protein [Gemmatimonadetes bacterium]|nr:ABC transporter ATP-binding protein [Gemmatimonadota bacterium]
MNRAHEQVPQGSVWAMARHFWRVAQAKPAHPMVVTLAANAFDAASLALLIPITTAVADNSFSFLPDSDAFGWIIELIPRGADSLPSDALLFGVIVSLIVLARLCKFTLLYLNTAYVVARTESYRVAISRETFSRVLTFGRRYFDRQALGGVDTEIQWSRSALRLLTAAEGLFRFIVGLIVKGVVMFAISAPLFLASLVSIPLVQWALRPVHRTIRRTAKEAASIQRRSRAQLLDILASIPLVGVPHPLRSKMWWGLEESSPWACA